MQATNSLPPRQRRGEFLPNVRSTVSTVCTAACRYSADILRRALFAHIGYIFRCHQEYAALHCTALHPKNASEPIGSRASESPEFYTFLVLLLTKPQKNVILQHLLLAAAGRHGAARHTTRYSRSLNLDAKPLHFHIPCQPPSHRWVLFAK